MHKEKFSWFHENDNKFNVHQRTFKSPDLSPVEQLREVEKAEILSMNIHLTAMKELQVKIPNLESIPQRNEVL